MRYTAPSVRIVFRPVQFDRKSLIYYTTQSLFQVTVVRNSCLLEVVTISRQDFRTMELFFKDRDRLVRIQARDLHNYATCDW